jgi:uncharacterized protein (TIGR00730 family)
MFMDDHKRIVVFGSSRCPEGGEVWSQAYEVGRQIGERGLTLVSGGYDGAMGAASRGVHESGGRVVGIITTIFTERTPNRYLDEERVESTYQERMAALLGAGDGYVALPGALGTLSEWLAAWCLATIRQLPGPLWAFEDPWRPFAESVMGLAEVAPEHRDLVRWVNEPAQLGRELDRWLGRSTKPVL